ncbi:unnamed protein product, partial [Effrenium voratum]
DRRSGFFEALVSWAAYVSEAKLARVVFVADSSFGEPSILAHLKDRPERLSTFQLQDIEEASVRRILQKHSQDLNISPENLKTIGGRYRDIAAMLGHMRHGVAAPEAVRWLLETAEVTVRRLLLTGQPGARWTRPQLWRAARLLAESPGAPVPYDVILWNVFRGDESALRSMKESNLIAVTPRKTEGKPLPLRYDVEPGSPLYGEVFRRLVQNEGLAAVLDLEVAKEDDVAREQKTIDAYEAELVRLEEILDARRDWWWSSRYADAQLEQRVAQLVDLIMEQHKKLEKYHKARRKAMKILGKSADRTEKGALGAGFAFGKPRPKPTPTPANAPERPWRAGIKAASPRSASTGALRAGSTTPRARAAKPKPVKEDEVRAQLARLRQALEAKQRRAEGAREDVMHLRALHEDIQAQQAAERPAYEQTVADLQAENRRLQASACSKWEATRRLQATLRRAEEQGEAQMEESWYPGNGALSSRTPGSGRPWRLCARGSSAGSRLAGACRKGALRMQAQVCLWPCSLFSLRFPPDPPKVRTLFRRTAAFPGFPLRL